MGHRIRRSDYPDYASYMDAIAEPIGGASNTAVWGEHAGVGWSTISCRLDRRRTPSPRR